MRTLIPLLALIPLLSACSSHDSDTNQSSSQNNSNVTMTAPHSDNLSDGAALTGGDFAHNENALRFIDYMVDKHHYDRNQLEYWISHAKRLDSVISLMDRQAPTPSSRPSGPTGAWLRYRKQFITPDNIKNGVAFWQQHAEIGRAHV